MGCRAFPADWDQVKALLGPTEVPERRGRKGCRTAGRLQPAHRGRRSTQGARPARERPVLIGHSYGGLIALLTAQERNDLKALVLYEPPLSINAATLESVGHALGSGDRDRALEIIAVKIAGMQAFRDADRRSGWLKAQDLLDTTFRELSAVVEYRYEPPKIVGAGHRDPRRAHRPHLRAGGAGHRAGHRRQAGRPRRRRPRRAREQPGVAGRDRATARGGRSVLTT